MRISRSKWFSSFCFIPVLVWQYCLQVSIVQNCVGFFFLIQIGLKARKQWGFFVFCFFLSWPRSILIHVTSQYWQKRWQSCILPSIFLTYCITNGQWRYTPCCRAAIMQFFQFCYMYCSLKKTICTILWMGIIDYFHQILYCLRTHQQSTWEVNFDFPTLAHIGVFHRATLWRSYSCPPVFALAINHCLYLAWVLQHDQGITSPLPQPQHGQISADARCCDLHHYILINPFFSQRHSNYNLFLWQGMLWKKGWKRVKEMRKKNKKLGRREAKRGNKRDRWWQLVRGG